MRLNAKQVCAYTGGTMVVPPLASKELLCGVTWDSREVEPGCLFVALMGEKVNGHSFVGSVLSAGAGAVLVMEPLPQTDLMLARELGAAVIEVADTASALTDLAREWRGHLKGHVVAITGSTGKTTTKNLVRDVCAAGKTVVATKANQNNELGVPRTLLSADADTQVVVVEMGMRGRGQIAALCDFVRPDWGLITNVGESHIELLGSRENIARAKGELLEALPSGTGIAFLNGEDDATAFMAQQTQFAARGVEEVRFNGRPAADCLAPGQVPAAAVWAEDAFLDEEGHPLFTLCAQGFEGLEPLDEVHRVPVAMALRGYHNICNGCAAAAVGLRLGLGLQAVAEALGASLPESGRQEVLKTRDGVTVVNDAYNANPDSMRAALRTFAAMETSGRHVAVLGDMGELGDFAESCHRGVGRAAACCDRLICVGPLSRFTAQGALEAGMDAAAVTAVDSVGQAMALLETELSPHDALLVKASHYMGLGRIADGLVN